MNAPSLLVVVVAAINSAGETVPVVGCEVAIVVATVVASSSYLRSSFFDLELVEEEERITQLAHGEAPPVRKWALAVNHRRGALKWPRTFLPGRYFRAVDPDFVKVYRRLVPGFEAWGIFPQD